MARYTFKVDKDLQRSSRWMFVVKRDGKPITAVGDFDSAKSAAKAGTEFCQMFLSIRDQIN